MTQNLSNLENLVFSDASGQITYIFTKGHPYRDNTLNPWKMQDGSKAPSKSEFVNWSYDQKTRTFRGEIVFAQPD